MFGHPRLSRSLSAAAIIVVPGIMGSELRENGETIWGFKSLGWYFDHWKKEQFRSLRLTEQERNGEYGRIVPTTLISSPAFLPKLDVVNPYDKLVARLRANAANPAAVTTFPYDWRLPVSYNGTLLARAIEQHAHNWSRHPALKDYLAEFPASRMKVVVVAHSMGGLVTQHAAAIVQVDRIIALGTPWRGSVKTIGAMATGDLDGMPFSAVAIRDLVTSIPSMYDLLPRWACVAPTDPEGDPTEVDEALITTLGGDPDLFKTASDSYDARSAASAASVEIVSVAGIKQPTSASVDARARIATGGAAVTVSNMAYKLDGNRFERDRKLALVTVEATGDGTVPHFSASLNDHSHKSVQRLQHSQLAYAAEGLAVASHFVNNSDEPQFLAPSSDLGVAVPQIVLKGSPVDIELTGADARSHVRVKIWSHAGHLVTPPVLETSDGRLCISAETQREGIYTVQVGDGHGTPLETSYVVLSE